MPFDLVKSLVYIAQPSSLAVLTLTLGLVLVSLQRARRFGLALCWLAVAYIYAAGISPLGNALILPLEERFKPERPAATSAPPDGIIILGGFEDGWVAKGRGQLALNEAAERITEGLRLAWTYPSAKIVFTGGVASGRKLGNNVAKPVLDYLLAAGISRDRIIIEDEARNTYENAIRTKALLKPNPRETWLLVTSAYHMPRSVGIFRKAGFAVKPWPVDYRTRNTDDTARFFKRFTNGLKRVDTAINEYLGLIVYYALGRTDALFPADIAPKASPKTAPNTAAK